MEVIIEERGKTFHKMLQARIAEIRRRLGKASSRQDADAILALAREALPTAEALHDAKRLMRAALNLYLGGKPLKSRELFKRTKT